MPIERLPEMEDVARDLLRSLRGSRSQTAFSRRLGYKSNVAYTWESGRRWPTAAEFFRAAARVGIDVQSRVAGFYRSPPTWTATHEITTREGVAAFLDDLRGEMTIRTVAERIGRSRHAVSRWLSGAAEPRLPDFLRLVESTSVRLLDLLGALVDVTVLPSVAEAWCQLEAQRRLAYDLPWTQAVLRALEIRAYTEHRHVPGWVAARIGLTLAEEERCLGALAAAGVIRWVEQRWVVEGTLAVDTRRDPVAGRRLKCWWARVGTDALEAGSDGLFSYNVFSVSDADLQKMRELHTAYFRQIRALVAASTPGERVAVVNVQLFALDPGPSGPPAPSGGHG